MKKNIKSMDGFAMAELLTVSLIIVLLFSVLFANFLPLVGEYENRMTYNNVTAEYAAFQLRKIYMDAIAESNVGEGKGKTVIDNAINTQGYFVVYNDTKKILNGEGKYETVDPNVDVLPQKNEGATATSTEDDEEESDDEVNESSALSDVKDLIRGYDIKEIIISKYVLNGNDSGPKYLKKYYKKHSGSVTEGTNQLYYYINYLPSYSKSRYATGGVADPYRIIIKTGTYGYATMQLASDPPTDVRCFDLEPTTGLNGDKNAASKLYYSVKDSNGVYTNYKVGAGLIITKFRRNVVGVNCKDTEIVIGDQSVSDGKGNIGVIVGIANAEDNGGKGVFEKLRGSEAITGISLSPSVKFIGSRAFAKNYIEEIEFSEDSSKGLFYIGDEAFMNNRLTSLSVPISDVSLGKGVFKNNTTLTNMELLINKMPNKANGNIVGNQLANSIVDSSGNPKPQKIVIPESMVQGNVKTPLDIDIPLVTSEIGAYAFQGLKIKDISFISETPPATGSGAGEVISEEESDGDAQTHLTTIGEEAFYANISDYGSDEIPDLDINIPYTVKKIGNRAFASNKIKHLYFDGVGVESTEDTKKSLLQDIGQDAFNISANSGDGGQVSGRCTINKTHTFVEGEITARILNIPSSLETIGARAFNCLYMDDVIIENIKGATPGTSQPSQLKRIGNEAFGTNFVKSDKENGEAGMSLSDFASFNFSDKLIKVTTENGKYTVDFTTTAPDGSTLGLGNKIFGESYNYAGFGSFAGMITVSEKGAIDMENGANNQEKRKYVDGWCRVLFGESRNEGCTFYKSKTNPSDPDLIWRSNYLEIYEYVSKYKALPPIDTDGYNWLKWNRQNPGQLNDVLEIFMQEEGNDEGRNYKIKKSQFLNKLNPLITNNINGTSWSDSVNEKAAWANYYERLQSYVAANNGFGNLGDESQLPINNDVVFLSQWYIIQKDSDATCSLQDDYININGQTKLKSVWLSEIPNWESCSGTAPTPGPNPDDGGDATIDEDILTYVCKNSRGVSVYISYVPDTDN